MGAHADHVRSYYAALNTGDAAAVAAHFTEDAVHWYTRRPPSRGAAQIGEHTQLAVEHLRAVWTIEHLVEGEDEVVIEWTMAWDHPRTGERCLDRGAEFLAFEGERICEVRAYYSRDGDLQGFDHAARGHTVLGGPPSASSGR
jgi:ketosteroid isomerase-like protein